MEIRNAEDKDRAEMMDNYIVEAAGLARAALERLQEARARMEGVFTDLPEGISDKADELAEKIGELEREMRKAARDWTAECIRIEDAINAYDEAERRGA